MGQIKNLLVFGGAFDPVHIGHAALLAAAQKEINPDLTLIVPAPDKPVHKPPAMLRGALRLALLRRCFKGKPRTRLSTQDMKKGRRGFAWETIKWLHRQYPKAHLWYLIGSDNLKALPSWKHPRRLFNDTRLTFVIGARQEDKLSGLVKACPAQKYHLLKSRFPAVASSQWRQFFLSGKPGAFQKILKHIPRAARPLWHQPQMLAALIKTYLRKKLPEPRYQHTLNVARLAKKLAQCHGLAPWPAQIAALLHDAGRTQLQFGSHQEAMGHSAQAAQIAKNVFGVTDPLILEAIRRHTLGKPGMGRLAQLIYVADLASYDRPFPQAQIIRRTACKNLKESLKLACATKLLYLVRNQCYVEPQALAFWNSLVKD